MRQIVLKSKRDFSLRRHHPWIFSGAIESGEDGVGIGELVEVVSHEGEKLGSAWYSPASQIRLRMVSFDEVVDEERLLANKVASAIGTRADFFANNYTNAIRLINAESDFLPGVVADYYAGFVVCQFTSAGAEKRKSEIANAIMKFAPLCRGVAERLDIDSRTKEGLAITPEFAMLVGEEPPATIEIFEGACKFLVDVRRGHKTGFYLDQRSARAMVGALANGREVLNCFSYTGGFGIHCRAAGASKVTQVDISKDALELAKRNETLTHLCGTTMEYVEADVFDYLRKCRDERKRFDMIILDPPKFAASKSQVMKAMRGYKDINVLAMKLLNPNGILASFSCSGAMSEEAFNEVITSAALDAKREAQLIAKTHQAADHPITLAFPEGLYLKGVILRLV